jgi:methylsterol monooxygenase
LCVTFHTPRRFLLQWVSSLDKQIKTKKKKHMPMAAPGMWVVSCTHMATYWLWVLLYHVFGRPFDPGQRRRLTFGVVCVVLINQSISYPVVEWFVQRAAVREEQENLAFSAMAVLPKLFGAAVVQALLFHLLHCLCHRSAWLYREFHCVHHSFKITQPVCALFAHPLEHVAVNVLPVMIGGGVVGMTAGDYAVWVFLATASTCHAHNALYRKDRLFYHQQHHIRVRDHFGDSWTEMVTRAGHAVLEHAGILWRV